jgi:hypothetical protein
MLLVPAGLGARAEASYRITDYHMSVEVLSDGSALVTEELAYHFDGAYNGILCSLDASGTDGIKDIQLYVDGIRQLRQVDEMNMEPLTFTVTWDGDLVNLKACAPGDGGDRHFRYKYRMKGLARRYQDAGRINFKFIGVNNQVPLENARITLALPGGGGPVYPLVHGAMAAEDMALSSTNALTLGPRTVQPGEFVELDALFPAEWLKGAPVIPENVLADALRTEADLAGARDAMQPTGFYCSDHAGVLSEAAKRHIEVNAVALCKATGAQIVFVTLETTKPLDIADYALTLFNSWGIGDAEKDNGILVLLAIADDDYYTLEGTGLEEPLPVGDLNVMWNQYLEPDFAGKDYSAGCVRYFDALFQKLSDLYGADLTLEDAA